MANKFSFEAFIKEHSGHEEIIKAVYEQLGCDDFEEFVAECENCTVPGGCGANAGFHGFIWYTETKEFYLKNRKGIIKILTELSEDIGDNSIIDTVLSFNSVDENDPMTLPAIALTLYGKDDQADQYISDYLAKFAFEEIANWMCNFESECDEN